MIAEKLMKRYGWNDIWSPTAGDPYDPPSRFFVGIWTGPDNDLICLKHCKTAKEAEEYLSPAGITLIDAAKKAERKLLWLIRKE